MNKTIATGFALLALTACGTAAADTATDTDTSEAPTTTEAPPRTTTPRTAPPRTTTSRISSEQAFANEILANIDLLDEGASAFSNVAEAIGRMDIVEASNYAAQGAIVFGDLRDIALGAPGRDTSVGLLTLNAFEVCEDALDMASTSLTSFDVARIQATTAKMDACTDAVGMATTAVEAAS